MKRSVWRLIAVSLVAAMGAFLFTACDDETPPEVEEPVPEPTYTVTYADGLDDVEIPMPGGASYHAGDFVSLSFTPAAAGYLFRGWNDGEKNYLPPALYPMPAHDVVFTAQWEEVPPPPVPKTHLVTLTYPETNGVSVELDPALPEDGLVEEDTVLTLTILCDPGSGKAIDKVTVNGEEISPEGSGVFRIVVTGETAIAVFFRDIEIEPEPGPEPTRYTVTYDLGAHGISPLPTYGPAEEGEEIVLADPPAAEEGWEFIEWTVSTASGREIPVSSGKFSMPAENVVIAATWRELPPPPPPPPALFLVTLEFDETAGSVTVEPALPEDGMVEEGTVLTLTALPAADHLLGEVLVGGRPVLPEENGTFLVTVTGETAIAVSFPEVEKFPVRYEGGTHLSEGATLPEETRVAVGTEIELAAPPEGEAGYTFVGWECNGETLPAHGTLRVEGETTLVAQWNFALQGIWSDEGDPQTGAPAGKYLIAEAEGTDLGEEGKLLAYAVFETDMEGTSLAVGGYVVAREGGLFLVVPLMDGDPVALTLSEGKLLCGEAGRELNFVGEIPAAAPLPEGELYGYGEDGALAVKIVLSAGAYEIEGETGRIVCLGTYAVLLEGDLPAFVLEGKEEGFTAFWGDSFLEFASEEPVTLTCDAGAGTGGFEGSYRRGTKVSGETFGVPTPPEGYDFVEWQREGEGVTEVVLEGDVLLTASYSPQKPTVEVRGVEGTETLDLVWNEAAAKWEGTLPAAFEPADGTVFVDWAIDVGGEITNADALTRLSLSPGNYTVTISPNTKEPEAIVVTLWYDETGEEKETRSVRPHDGLALPAESDRRVGYRLKGWRPLDGGDLLTGWYFPEEEITLVAVWEKLKFTVTFLYGEGTEETRESETLEWGERVSLTPPKAKAEWRFKRFEAETEGGESIAVEDGGFVLPMENVVVTAVWARLYSVRYEDGVEDEEIPVPADPTLYEEGETVVLPSERPARKGFAFLGWKTGEDQELKAAGESVPMEKGGLVFTAKWEAEAYAVSYDLGTHAAADAVPPEERTAHYLETVELADPPKAEKGYEFAGWTATAAGGENVPITENAITMPAESVSVSALWRPIEYTIRFDANVPKGASDKVKGNAEEIVVSLEAASISLPELSLAGYRFKGWTMGDSPFTAEAFTAEMIPEEGTLIVLTAQWKKLVRATFDLGGCGDADYSGSKEAYGARVLEEGEMIEVPDPVWEGYVFDGWSVNNAKAQPDLFEGGFPVVEDTEFKAVWSPEVPPTEHLIETDYDDIGRIPEEDLERIPQEGLSGRRVELPKLSIPEFLGWRVFLFDEEEWVPLDEIEVKREGDVWVFTMPDSDVWIEVIWSDDVAPMDLAPRQPSRPTQRAEALPPDPKREETN